MSTNGITSWAVDLQNIGAVYPFQGWEVLMVILGLIFWVGFHVLQIRNEHRDFRYGAKADPKGEWAKQAISNY